MLELRLPWDLLNITDPSTRTLLFDRDSVGDYGTAKAGEFHVGVLVYRKPTGKAVSALPALREGTWPAQEFTGWQWDEWKEPRYHGRLKPVYDSLKALWGSWRAAASSGSRPARSLRPAPSN